MATAKAISTVTTALQEVSPIPPARAPGDINKKIAPASLCALIDGLLIIRRAATIEKIRFIKSPFPNWDIYVYVCKRNESTVSVMYIALL